MQLAFRGSDEVDPTRGEQLSPGDLLLNGLGVGLSKQVEHGAAEVVGVAVWVAQLIGYRVQEQVSPWKHEKMETPSGDSV